MKDKCYECHNEKKTKGDIDLKKLDADPQVAKQFDIWVKVKDTIDNGDMPPPKAHQMTEKEHEALVGWVTGELDALAMKQAGDPGPVTMRRLTNAEYDYTVRDLTGQDFGFGKEFTTDGGGGEGFSNTGDVLFISPAQLDKYFGAARKIADQASILPGTGVQFQSARVGLRGAEQWKGQAERSLYIWYQKKAAPLLPKDEDDLREADYMLACWKWKHKDKTGAQSLEQLAKEMKLNTAFLNNWWTMLNKTEPKSRFLDLTRLPWQQLPAPDAAKPKEVPAAVMASLKANEEQRKAWYYKDPKKPGSGHVQRQQQDADALRPYPVQGSTKGKPVVHLCIGDDGDGAKGDIALVSDIQVYVKKNPESYLKLMHEQVKKDKDALTKPGAKVDELNKRIASAEAMFAKFGKHPLGTEIKPDVLAIAAPQVIDLPLPEGANYIKASCKLDINTPDVDVATIQWVITADTPPDVTKIIPGALTVWKLRTTASGKTMRDFSRMRQVFPDEYDRRLEEVARNYYSKNPGVGVYYYSDEQLGAALTEADRKQLERMKYDWGYTAPLKLDAQRQKEWDQLVTGHLHWFAGIAWRRPLEQAEKDKLAKLYQAGIAEGLDRESAARQVIVRVLVSPNFLFKAETLPVIADNTTEIPLGPWELASRLSYFLWSSLPDESLRSAAADGSILKKEVMAAQVKRMLADPRAEAMAKEYAGQWLEFNTFGGHAGVDEKKFPEFTPELRKDMHSEIITFFSKMVREDRSVNDILGANYSFINERLAKFYGVPGVTGEELRQVNVSAQHRGGLLGMGAMLTKTSRPNRTSPVVRGNYLYQVVLGISAPPPPPNVPKLPEGAVKPTNMRAMLLQHRQDHACAVCHERIDPMGFALEGFDPIGRVRVTDDTGIKIDDSAETKDGTKFVGLDGLRGFLQAQDDQFKTQVCRKLLGYALGRQTMPSDKPLIAEMKTGLKNNGGKFSTAVLAVVNSRQFLHRRAEKNVASK